MSTATKPAGPAPLSKLVTKLRNNPLLGLIIGSAMAIALVVALVMWATRPPYRVLFSNLSESDGGAIINELDSRGVPYQFAAGGQALLVPSNLVHSLRLQLAEKGLPHAGNVGMELMEHQAFGISQFAEQINYQRGLEGELARSISSLGPVASARVHLALAKDSVFVRDRKPAKASVVLTLEPGRTLGGGQVAAMIHLVSSSVPDLTAEDVTVIDQNGHLLSTPTTQNSGLDSTQLDYVASVESALRQRIEKILGPIVGPHNVQAQVTAQIDFSSHEETAEHFVPNQPPNEAAVRSRQTSLDVDGKGDLAKGIPGALSNTPPGTAPSPVEGTPTEEPKDGATANQQGTDNAQSERMRRDDVINYEVDHQVSHIQHQRGQIKRLTAAVVINYISDDALAGASDNAEAQKPHPLDEAQLAQIDKLVRQAMGYSADRGDDLVVVNRPFITASEETPLPWWQNSDLQHLAIEIGRYLLVGLIILFVYRRLLRPVVKHYLETSAPQTALQAREETEDDTDMGRTDDSEEPDSGDTTYTRASAQRRKATTYEQHLNELRELAQEDPRLVAMIVRGWMNENDPS
ncbi:flagellar basal-body MS-ring/collar protein FliF [Halomonas binhaiensis]|uniref:Flagellar M-ring protein n=1 Tax=Halomonas binhaiensis TaxID=2562282 RepID=A0A5C1NLX1_9GAMM|nr:flagellar basal-body MS-ring/collar protein FliF [Halomonas binhaiensis]QEM83830.1 flagellar M-ring protein FliF [Halomonas binhaiensis]